MKLTSINGTFSIIRLAASSSVPAWVYQSPLYSITKTDDEISILCESSFVHEHFDKQENHWKCLKVVGPLEFSLTGILATLTQPLAKAKISIFALSTFDTDYIFMKQDRLTEAIRILKQEGHEIITHS